MPQKLAKFRAALRRYWWAWGLLTIIIVALAFIPPVWQLTYRKTITITRWPKSGEELVTIGPGKKHWVDISKVSRHVLNAIIVAEDSRFSTHQGLDFVEIHKSLKTNLSQKRIVRGGSTITQQLIKMVFLSPDRTYTRKAREAIGALILEQLVDKKSILEWYINLIEFGDGVYGIHDAAHHYFATKPELLTIQQGANLALVIPSPNGWSVGLRRKELTEFGQKRYGHIIFQMFQNGFITKDLMLTALATGNFGKPVASYRKYRQAFETAPYDPHRDPPKQQSVLDAFGESDEPQGEPQEPSAETTTPAGGG